MNSDCPSGVSKPVCLPVCKPRGKYRMPFVRNPKTFKCEYDPPEDASPSVMRQYKEMLQKRREKYKQRKGTSRKGKSKSRKGNKKSRKSTARENSDENILRRSDRLSKKR